MSLVGRPVATVTALVTVGVSFDDEPTVNFQPGPLALPIEV
jgi:hypothetical protein